MVRHDGQPIPESDRTIEITYGDHFVIEESETTITQTLPVAPDGLVVFNIVMPANKTALVVVVIF